MTFQNTILLLSLLLLVGPASAQSIIPAGRGEEAMIGKGYDPDTQTFVGRCLKTRYEEVGQPVANIDFTQSISQSELADELGFGAGGRFKYGMATVGASAKFFKQQQASSFSISSIYTGEYRFKNLVLNFEDNSAKNDKQEDLKFARMSDVGKSVANNPPNWLDTCGTEYVDQIERGAKLFYSIRIDFSSVEEKQVFETAFSYESSYASVQAYLKISSRSFSKNTKVTISALQIGGDVTRVTELFNAEKDDQSAMGFVQCTFGDFSKCDKVMESAWNYATKEFKKQLSTNPQTAKAEHGPAYLTYRTKKYSAAGIYSDLPTVVTLSIKNARRDLEKSFDKQMNYLGEIRHLLFGKTVVLSPSQRKSIQTLDQAVSANIDLLVDAALVCYDKPLSCMENLSGLTDSKSGIQEIDETKLVIKPETFQQFCALSSSPVAPAKLRKSIEGMIQAAKRANATAFDADSNGRTDSCLIAHMVFSQSTTANFSGLSISTLEPLQEYTHFTAMDLSGNLIEDLLPLSNFQNLEDLNLHDNKVRSLDSLSKLRALKKIRVSNNSLRSIDALASLPDLVRVDARNNFPTVTCEPLKRLDVCMSSSVRTDANFVAVATSSTTPFFMPSLAELPMGNVLLIGMGDFAQTYNPQLNLLNPTMGLGGKSYGHKAAALLDGRILITGGWGGLRRLAIYDPGTSSFSVKEAGLQTQRAGHQSTTLLDGRVLITGGWEGGGTWSGSNATYTAEIFDPATNQTFPIAHMHAPRAWHTATRLQDGRVLIAGGFSFNGSLATIEIFNPATNQFEVVSNSMSEGRGSHSATLLKDGRVLIAGGFTDATNASATAEIFDPIQLSFKQIFEPLNEARGAHAAVRLANGKVLLTGGSSEVFAPTEAVPSSNLFIGTGELFDVSENSFTQVPAKMFVPRSHHAMIEVKPGLVLIVGGLSQDAVYQSETFTYTDLALSLKNLTR